MALAPAMRICITASGLLAVAFIWLGPETRGLTFRALDEPADPRRLDFLNAAQTEIFPSSTSGQNQRLLTSRILNANVIGSRTRTAEPG